MLPPPISTTAVRNTVELEVPRGAGEGQSRLFVGANHVDYAARAAGAHRGKTRRRCRFANGAGRDGAHFLH